ncbi:signal peptidase I [Alkalihalobacillus trypoxylicola]|uniref:signal peptidase I n=1 Tax=Alkalihalobacillus trypoxylicola TaxID=519424 RepID=UPI000AF9D4CC
MEDNMKEELKSWATSIAVGIVIACLCKAFLFAPMTVFGESMSPTFEDQDRLMISKITSIERLDVIVFEAPNMLEERYIKRVIGLPGDRIEMKNDQLLVNDEIIEEPYIWGNGDDKFLGKITEDFTLEEMFGVSEVPNGMYFVLGDNRRRSLDSRNFGFISEEIVIGEVKLRFYPFSSFGFPSE